MAKLPFLRKAVLVAFVMGLSGSIAHAQRSREVTLLLKDAFGRDDIVAIVRIDRAKFGRPVVAIKRSALSPELLKAAVVALENASTQFGDSTNKVINVEFNGKQRLRALDASKDGWMRGALASLIAQPEKQVAKIGHARELVVSIPSQE